MLPTFVFLPADPYRWNSEQVQKWVEWTRHQYRLPEIEVGFFSMDGMTLCNLTDEQFRQILPKSGDILYAHLDIWKNGKQRTSLIILRTCCFFCNGWQISGDAQQDVKRVVNLVGGGGGCWQIRQRILLRNIKQTTSQNAYILYGRMAGNQRNPQSKFYLLSSSMKLAPGNTIHVTQAF